GRDGAVTEHVGDTHTEQEVQPRHERHHDDHEHEHNTRVGEQLLARRSDNLRQLIDHLAYEQSNARERPAALRALRLRRCDDILRGNVGVSTRHLHYLPGWFRETPEWGTRSRPPLAREPICRADRTRTCNLRFWRPLLYQLSHRPRRAT